MLNQNYTVNSGMIEMSFAQCEDVAAAGAQCLPPDEMTIGDYIEIALTGRAHRICSH
ncbi:hypothetical protein [Chromobacterium sp. IIBBL 290-4]|uniref:hypothetical protein n=1 Tax=Chromobacterium sp. IIBBL 290-4 TaxID=2953890 RepID=UPI0020B6598C|nr:hypothetical protein [Chromobacterium sp. IIBBL 290-4]UTH73730.1 hypothetical protein NKT35_19630 [Chromobacterium sp. IIBBL 290-4]